MYRYIDTNKRKKYNLLSFQPTNIIVCYGDDISLIDIPY